MSFATLGSISRRNTDEGSFNTVDGDEDISETYLHLSTLGILPYELQNKFITEVLSFGNSSETYMPVL